MCLAKQVPEVPLSPSIFMNFYDLIFMTSRKFGKEPFIYLFLTYRNYLKERPGLNESPLRMSAPLFTAEKFNELRGLNKRPLKPEKGRSFGNLQCLQRRSFR